MFLHQPRPIHLRETPPSRERSALLRGEAPSGFCFKGERQHFGAAARAGFGWGLRRERRAPGGDCGTSAGLSSPVSAGQRPATGCPHWPGSDSAPDPRRGNSLDIKGDQSWGGTSHPGTTFLPLLPLLPVVLFLVTSFSWQQNVGGRGRGRYAGKSLLGTGHNQENNVVGRSRKRVRGKGRSRENREAGGGRQPSPAPSQG